MRGQAHIVFRNVNDASAAMRGEQGREFFGRELKVQYARGKSDVIRRLDGTFRLPEEKGKAEGAGMGMVQMEVFGQKAPGTVGSAAEVQLPPVPRVEAEVDGDGAKGVKRAREESEGEEEDEGQPMEEESDVEMEASSGDDSD